MTNNSQVLTNEEIDDIWVEHGLNDEDVHGFARAIEQAVLEKLIIVGADMFWDADNTEDCLPDGEYDAVQAVVESSWKPEMPFEFQLMRAMRLPSINVTVTAAPEDGDIEYATEIASVRSRVEGEK